jgi:hypothetical protein
MKYNIDKVFMTEKHNENAFKIPNIKDNEKYKI